MKERKRKEKKHMAKGWSPRIHVKHLTQRIISEDGPYCQAYPSTREKAFVVNKASFLL